MEKFLKLFRNRKLGFSLTIITSLLILATFIVQCVNLNRFSVTTFVVDIAVIALLILMGIGICSKKRKAAEIASAAIMGYWGIYLISIYGGPIRAWTGPSQVAAIFFVLGAFCLLGALGFMILRPFGIVKSHFSTLITSILLACLVFNVIAVICYAVGSSVAVKPYQIIETITFIFVPICLTFTTQDREASAKD